MTDIELAIVIISSVWMFVSVACAVFIYMIIDKKYRRFYPHPLVALVKDIQNDTENHYPTWFRIMLYTLYTLLWIPITTEWVLGWAVYNGARLLIRQYATMYDISITAQDENVETVDQPDNQSTLNDYEIPPEDLPQTISTADVIESESQQESVQQSQYEDDQE